MSKSTTLFPTTNLWLLRPKKIARKHEAFSVKGSPEKPVTEIEACCGRQFLSCLLDGDPYLLNQH